MRKKSLDPVPGAQRAPERIGRRGDRGSRGDTRELWDSGRKLNSSVMQSLRPAPCDERSEIAENRLAVCCIANVSACLPVSPMNFQTAVKSCPQHLMVLEMTDAVRPDRVVPID